MQNARRGREEHRVRQGTMNDADATMLAEEKATVAAAKREHAELEAAEANLRRQQKLLKLGIAQKSDVIDAQEKLAQLKAQKK